MAESDKDAAQELTQRATDLEADQPEADKQRAAAQSEVDAANLARISAQDQADRERHEEAHALLEAAIPDGAGFSSENPGARTQEEAKKQNGRATGDEKTDKEAFHGPGVAQIPGAGDPSGGAPRINDDVRASDASQGPAKLEPEGDGKRWAAEIHYPGDVRGVADKDAYVKEQVKSLGHQGGSVVSEEPHPDGGLRIRVEG